MKRAPSRGRCAGQIEQPPREDPEEGQELKGVQGTGRSPPLLFLLPLASPSVFPAWQRQGTQLGLYSAALGSRGAGRVQQQEFGKTYVSFQSGLESVLSLQAEEPCAMKELGEGTRYPTCGQNLHSVSHSAQGPPNYVCRAGGQDVNRG